MFFTYRHLFILIGIILVATLEDGLNIEGFILSGLGVFFALLGVILYFAIPQKGNYTRYKKSINRFGGVNSYNIVIRIGLLEERVKALEEENKALKEQLYKK